MAAACVVVITCVVSAECVVPTVVSAECVVPTVVVVSAKYTKRIYSSENYGIEIAKPACI